MGVTEIHVIAPGICGPLCETGSLEQNDTVRRWVQWLSRSEEHSSYNNLDTAIAGVLDIEAVESDLPSAALIMKAGDRYDANRCYMQAAPVHLEADLDHAVLTPAADLSITEGEAEALCEALNRHFEEDGLSFERVTSDQWVVSSEEEIQITTTTLSDAVGRKINFLLPQGVQSGYWKKILTEAQMLMHAHDVNVRRSDSGLMTINSLWFYGAGRLPGTQMMGNNKSQQYSVCSRELLFKGVAKDLACDHLDCTSVETYIDYIRSAGQAKADKQKHVLHLPDLEHVVNYTDVMPWSRELEALLVEWIYPLISYANKKGIRIVIYPCNGKQYSFSKYDRWKFWRRGKLKSYINSFQSENHH